MHSINYNSSIQSILNEKNIYNIYKFSLLNIIKIYLTYIFYSVKMIISLLSNADKITSFPSSKCWMKITLTVKKKAKKNSSLI